MACKWCGSALPLATAEFCATCKAPQRPLAQFLYSVDFLARNLAIPLAIGVVTFLLATWQQDATRIVADRQRLAESLSDVEKVGDEERRAYTQILFMATSSGTTVPAKDLKDAATNLDEAIASFGQKLGPFEEFARRTKYYTVKPNESSPIQKVWDRCFVYPYFGNDKKPGYLKTITDNLAKCVGADCPKAVAQELKHVIDEFYQGYCKDGDPMPHVQQIWFNRELRRISIQEPRAESDVYDLGSQ
jgi:hypothetical protein